MCGGRAAGRCGAGAVMGSKNLLAIAVKGTGKIPIANPNEFSTACKEGYRKALAQSSTEEGMSFTETGTPGYMMTADPKGDWPTKNSRSNSWGKGKEFYDYFKNSNFVKPNPCYKGCVLKCGRICKVDSGKWVTPQHEGAEYESLSSFTAFVMNENVDAAVHAGYLCNEYGIDTISTGVTIAFAMEEVDGLDLTWGNTETMVELVKKIANRDGIGYILGEGVRRASQKIGKGSDKLAIHVKGLESPAHDARSAKLQAITYGTGNRGMCHTHSAEGLVYDQVKMDLGLIPYGIPDPHTIDRFAEENKGEIAKMLQDFEILPDILGICRFYTYFNALDVGDLAKMISSITGWDIDGGELLAVGERVYNLQRMFNVREGIRKSDDMLPERCLKLPEFGRYASVKECEIKDQVRMLEEYYEARGWDKETGVPLERET
jgi:aldehyde:ferredoxin oxidoreductase